MTATPAWEVWGPLRGGEGSASSSLSALHPESRSHHGYHTGSKGEDGCVPERGWEGLTGIAWLKALVTFRVRSCSPSPGLQGLVLWGCGGLCQSQGSVGTCGLVWAEGRKAGGGGRVGRTGCADR